MKIKKTALIATLAAFLFLAAASESRAQVIIDPEFNPNRILEDAQLLEYNSMSLNEIQDFLRSKGSYLANYTTLSSYGEMKSAAEIIYDAAYRNYDCSGIKLSDEPTLSERMSKCQLITTVSPKFLLVLLQKESSLVEDANPSQGRLDWATGYGCPDNWACNPYFKGFGKQVNSAALQFRAYMNKPQNYSYRVGQTYTFSNPYGTISNETMTVTPVNQATASLYNYTPHVFNGNYNVFRLWKRYFSSSSSPTPTITLRKHPDGSLVKASGDPRIWLIENGKKRHIANWSTFISRFRLEQVVEIQTNELAGYPAGADIKFPNYSIVRTPDKTIYLLVDKEKRPFADDAAFKKIGFNPAEIQETSAEDLNGYIVGDLITATTNHAVGVLMQDSQKGDIYYVENGTKAPVDKVLLDTKFAGKTIEKKTTKQLAAFTDAGPILLNDGSLARTSSFPLVYMISEGKKRPIDDVVFARLGYNPDSVITVSSQYMYNYPMGEPVK